ncbi:hypothetical protein V6N13_149678 [Hibiscus sabdariffa]
MRLRSSFMFMGRFSDAKAACGGVLFAKEVLVLDCKILVILFENWMQRHGLYQNSCRVQHLSSECKLIQFRFIRRAENKMAASLAIDGFSGLF